MPVEPVEKVSSRFSSPIRRFQEESPESRSLFDRIIGVRNSSSSSTTSTISSTSRGPPHPSSGGIHETPSTSVGGEEQQVMWGMLHPAPNTGSNQEQQHQKNEGGSSSSSRPSSTSSPAPALLKNYKKDNKRDHSSLVIPISGGVFRFDAFMKGERLDECDPTNRADIFGVWKIIRRIF